MTDLTELRTQITGEIAWGRNLGKTAGEVSDAIMAKVETAVTEALQATPDKAVE